MTEYTPTTDDVRAAYWVNRTHEAGSRWFADDYAAEFDRWLIEHNRQVAAQALRDVADDLRGRRMDAPSEWADDVLRGRARWVEGDEK